MISIIIPTYNEKENIVKLLSAVSSRLDGIEHEIIVVDDKSPDGTAQAAAEAHIPDIRVIVRDSNPGLANSIRCGMEASKGDELIVMDSDFDHDPSQIPLIVERLKRFDCVSVSRFISKIKGIKGLRTFFSLLSNMALRALLPDSLTDNFYGYFGIKRVAVSRLPSDKIFFGFGDYFMRLVYYLRRENISIIEIAATDTRRTRGLSKNTFCRSFIIYLVSLIRLVYISRVRDV